MINPIGLLIISIATEVNISSGFKNSNWDIKNKLIAVANTIIKVFDFVLDKYSNINNKKITDNVNSIIKLKLLFIIK